MDKFLAKIDEYTEKLTSMKILSLLNELIKYIGEALKAIDEDEAGKIMGLIYGFGEKAE